MKVKRNDRPPKISNSDTTSMLVEILDDILGDIEDYDAMKDLVQNPVLIRFYSEPLLEIINMRFTSSEALKLKTLIKLLR